MKRTWWLAAMAALLVAAWLPVGARAQEAGDDAAANADIFKKLPSGGQAYVVIRDWTAFDTKVGRLQMTLVPQAMMQQQPGQAPEPAAPLRNALTEAFGESLPKAGTPVAVVFRLKADPEGDLEQALVKDEPPMALLVQPPDVQAVLVGEALGDGIFKKGNRQYLAAYGDSVILAQTEALARELKDAEPGVTLSAKQRAVWRGKDVFAMADAAAIQKQFEPMYKEFLAKSKQNIAELEEKGGQEQMVQQTKMQREMAQAMWGFGEQVARLTAGAVLDVDAIDAHMALEPKADTKLADYFTGHPALDQPFGPALPEIDHWSAFWMSLDNEKYAQMLADYYGFWGKLMTNMGPMPGQHQGDPKAMANLMTRTAELVRTNAEAIPEKSSGLVYNLAGGGMGCLAVLEVGDTEAYRRTVEELSEQMAELMQEMAKAAAKAEEIDDAQEAPEIKATYEKGVRTVGELTLDKWSIDLAAMAANAQQVPGQPAPAQMFKAMFGSEKVVVWLGFRGEHVLAEMGPEPVNIQKAVEALDAGEGLAAGDAGKALRKQSLEGANMVMAFDMGGYMDFLLGVMAAAQGGQMPQMPPGREIDPLIVSAAFGDGTAELRYNIPVATAQQAMQRFMMLMMMQMMQPPNAPAPPGAPMAPEARNGPPPPA